MNNENDILPQIEPYKRPDGSYDINRLESDLGIAPSLDRTFAMFFAGGVQDDDPRIKLAVEINGRLHDEAKAAERTATQEALNRALAGTGNADDWRLLANRGLAVAEYNDPQSNAVTGYHLGSPLGGYRDTDGNEYTDQSGLEEKPGRL